MENLRWILIVAGVAILLLLYFTGRSQRDRRDNLDALRENRKGGDSDPLLGDDGYLGASDDYHTQSGDYDFDDLHPDDMVRPGNASFSEQGNAYHDTDADYDYGELDETQEIPRSGMASLSEKIEAISQRLRPKRKERVANSAPEDDETDAGYASKIVTLHVVAPDNQYIPGDRLLDVLQQRGYHFGDMNVFHSMHNGETVFVIAKVVEPGYFDMDNIESFSTPGISLILQLPGPVPADVAFEVLVSEAFEMAQELGAQVLDGDRSSLSNQTVQHMREGIYEYMHRQKYFGNVAS